VRASVDKSGCIACGLCESICPEVFRSSEDGTAEVYVDPVPVENEEAAKEAADSCPVSVISIEE